MKHIRYLLLLVLLLPAIGWAGIYMGMKKSTEYVTIPLLKPLDASGLPGLPDSVHVRTWRDDLDSACYHIESTSYPFTAAGIDTCKAHGGDTTYVFRDQIQDVDGGGGTFGMSFDITLFTGGVGTQTQAYVQVISDSINQFMRDVTEIKTRTDSILDTLHLASRLVASDNIGINWADVANPTTAVGLTQTNIRDVSLNDADSVKLLAIKTATDQLNFTGTDVKATLDGEKVVVTSFDADAINAAAIAADGIAEIQNGLSTFDASTDSVIVDVSAAATANGLVDEVQSGLSTFSAATDSVTVDVSNAAAANGLIALTEDAVYANKDDYKATGFSTFDNTSDSVIVDVSAAATASGLVDEVQSGLSTFDNTTDSVLVDVSAAATAAGLIDEIASAVAAGSVEDSAYILDDFDGDGYITIEDWDSLFNRFFTTATTMDSIHDSTGVILQKLAHLGLTDSSSAAVGSDTAAIRAAFENWPVVANAVEINDNAEAAETLAVICDPDEATDILTTSNTATASAFKDSIWAIHASEVYNAAGDTSLVDKLLSAAAAGGGDTNSFEVEDIMDSMRALMSDSNMARYSKRDDYKATSVAVASIANDAITAASIATDAIGATEIAANAIGASELAANCITSSEIADGAIDAGAIATDAITAAKLATNAITSDEIAAGAIVNGTEATGFLGSTALDSVNNAITATNKANFKADVSALATLIQVDTIHMVVSDSSVSVDTTGIAVSVYTEFTDGTNENEFKADVSGLATLAQVDTIHMVVSDSGTAATITETDIKTIANRVYDTMYVHANDFKGGTGTGSDPLQVYLYNTADSSAIAGVNITVDTKWDGSGSEVVTETDGNGLAAFNMADGDSLLIAAYQPPWTFTTDSIVKAAGTDVDTIWGTMSAPGAPSAADICSLYCWSTVYGDGLVGGRVTATLQSSNDSLFSGTLQYLKIPKWTVINDTDGYWSLGLVPNAVIDTASSYRIEITRGSYNETWNIYIPDSNTVHLRSVLK